MKLYEILDINDIEYKNLIIICNANSPLEYLEDICSDLTKRNIEGKILIDEILHVGNNDKRFIEFMFKPNIQYSEINLKFINIKKDNALRRISCNYIKENKLTQYSILTSIQKRMIDKGMSI